MAPLTSAEKMRRRRQKLKEEGKFDEYRKRQSELEKISRERKKESLLKVPLKQRLKDLNKQRAATRERVRRHRILKKEKALSSPMGFRSNSSLGKAAARVKKILPKSPNRRKAVVKKLFSDYVSPKHPSECRKLFANSQTNVELEKSVKEFYCREDISREVPGMKDARTIRDETGKKEKVQIRHLTCSIKEVHALYCQEYGKCIGKTKFFELRPKEVKLSSMLPHNVCLCKYHENFIQAVSAFQKSYNLNMLGTS